MTKPNADHALNCPCPQCQPDGWVLRVKDLRAENERLSVENEKLTLALLQLKGVVASDEPGAVQVALEPLRQGECKQCGRAWEVKGTPGAAVSVLAFSCTCGYENK